MEKDVGVIFSVIVSINIRKCRRFLQLVDGFWYPKPVSREIMPYLASLQLGTSNCLPFLPPIEFNNFWYYCYKTDVTDPIHDACGKVDRNQVNHQKPDQYL